ncbi:MAG TPA: site-2 protease family protein [Bryobacteraceae bacterium]|jgi:Zn-dependent protease/predicted transcriptional regulator|nr:site-2 protease family protein [Bryobacteraceae bacterium]
MFRQRLTLFRLLGFDVRVDASWLILAALITWSLAVGYFPHVYPDLPQSDFWWMGIAGAIGLFASIVFHELSHSLVARRFGIPITGITLFIFGGLAEMDEEPASPKAELMMALAGPFASVILGGFLYSLARATGDSWPVPLTAVLAYLGWINLVLAVFNLIPAFPLDGGRVLRAIVWRWKADLRSATRIAAFAGEMFALLLMAVAVIQLFFGNLIGAIWLFLIGMFLSGASRASYEQVVLRTTLQGEPVRRFMNTAPIAVAPAITIQEFVDQYVYQYHHKMFPVVLASRWLMGYVTTAEVKSVPREQWNERIVRDIFRPVSAENTVGTETDAVTAMTLMSRGGNTRLMVVEGDRLVGIVTLRDLLDFLTTKLDLEGGRSLTSRELEPVGLHLPRTATNHR